MKKLFLLALVLACLSSCSDKKKQVVELYVDSYNKRDSSTLEKIISSSYTLKDTIIKRLNDTLLQPEREIVEVRTNGDSVFTLEHHKDFISEYITEVNPLKYKKIYIVKESMIDNIEIDTVDGHMELSIIRAYFFDLMKNWFLNNQNNFSDTIKFIPVIKKFYDKGDFSVAVKNNLHKPNSYIEFFKNYNTNKVRIFGSNFNDLESNSDLVMKDVANQIAGIEGKVHYKAFSSKKHQNPNIKIVEVNIKKVEKGKRKNILLQYAVNIENELVEYLYGEIDGEPKSALEMAFSVM